MDFEDARDSTGWKTVRDLSHRQGGSLTSSIGKIMSKTVDLTRIVTNRSAEVSDMIAAINGDPGRVLWTSEFRTAVRGGKPLVGPRIEE
jgi:hypothetical protein